MKLTTSIFALVALAGSATAATTYYDSRTYYSDTTDVGSSYANFNVAKFNITGATLTSVTVKVVQSTMTGSITVTNTGSSVAASIEEFDSAFTARQLSGGSNPNLGYSQTTVDITDVGTTPAWQSATIQPSVAQTFNIASGQTFAVLDQSIASTFWGAYTGSGNVTFQARDVQTVTVIGDSFQNQSGNAKATTQFAVVYNFSIPEPSTALLGGLASMLLFRRRR